VSLGGVVALLGVAAVAAGVWFGGGRLWRAGRYQSLRIQESELAAPTGQVLLYSASWCGKSKRAKQLLESSGVAYQEIDIDRREGAREDLATLRSPGVPVLVIGDRKIIGFDEKAYRYLVENGDR
jgi:glutaredoxin